jgi:hypothetical protein
MSAFIEMLDDLPPEAKRRLLLGWVPILLVIILLCVFGGLPPTSWGLTLRFLALMNALQGMQGSSVPAFPHALLVQSVCIFMAWLLVLLAIVSEFSAFKSIQTQVRISRLQAQLATSASNRQAPALVPAPTPSPVVVPSTIALPPSVAASATNGSLNGMSPASTGIVMNSASASMNIVAPPQPQNYGMRVIIDNTPGDYPANPFVSKTADAKEKSTGSQGVKTSPDQQSGPDPFSVQDDLFDLSDEQDNSFSQQDEQPAQQEDSVQEESIFVYGDPFEGELPEVFTYDKDLQKAVEDVRNAKRASDSKDANTSEVDQDEPDENSE